VPVALALAVAGCMHEQQAYYIIDPQTGQPVPVVQRYDQGADRSSAQQPYAQQAYAQQSYGQPRAARASSRGLFSSLQTEQAYTPQYGQSTPGYQPAPPPQHAQTAPGYQPAPPQYAAQGGRGVLSSRSAAPPPQYPQSAQSYPQPKSYVLQYHPPQAAQGGPYAAAPYGYAYAPPHHEPGYTLDSGDKLRIVVFGQEGISGTYTVDAGGNVSLPLVGTVPARGATTQKLAQVIGERLKQGYVREPHVTVTIDTYRPFFILGEVTTPGQYPYVPNMTVEKAVAVAGGFSPRAKKDKVELTRNSGAQRFTGDVPTNYPLRPGDTVVVKERWF
jgi:polysaccharide export outer membrane protein